MDVIMFHSGGELPGYLECTFKQFRLFNPDATVHFLTDAKLLTDTLFNKYKIKATNKDLYTSQKINEISRLYKKPPEDFWVITTTRLIYFENYIKQHALKDVYHFENDILIYFDLLQHDLKFKLYNDIAITVGGPDKIMTGFMYIKNGQSLAHMTDFFIRTLNQHGLVGTRKRYNLDMINEMTLMKAYQIAVHDNVMTGLPTIPFGEDSRRFALFNSIFDPASWGQYVGGTLGEGPGAKPEDHYIGQLLRNNPSYDVVWQKDEQGRNIPYFKYDGKMVKINNLHIHSKNLHKYVSY